MTCPPQRPATEAGLLPADHQRGAAARADAAVCEVLRGQYAGEPARLVPSPPGAGKTDLIEKVAVVSAGDLHERCVVVTQTNHQALAFVARLRAHFPKLPVTLFARDGLAVPDTLLRGPCFRVAHEPGALPTGPCLVVATAAKLLHSRVPLGAFDLLVVDEAYQLPNHHFLGIAGLAARVLLVGDPGQIAPLIRAAVTRWSADPAGPHVSAPQALLATHPATPCTALPVSRRLVDDSAAIVRAAFYPALPFEALERTSNRRVEFRRIAAAHPLDQALHQVEAGRTISMLELPAASADAADPEIAAVIVSLLNRALERGAHLVEPTSATRVDGARVGVVCANRAQVRAVRERLGAGLRREVLVETANRYQGLERDLVVAWHPLAGRAAIRDFHVDAGRFCVMLSRHRAACVVVGRADMHDVLDRYVPEEPPPLGAADDAEYAGWESHRRILHALAESDRVVRAAA